MMKPAGPERDKQIAEIRGDEYLSGHYRPYSTNITFAMELWEEMKAAHCAMTIEYTPVYRGIKMTLCHGVNNTVWTVIEGETLADAISGAWLKWKDTP